MIYDPQIQYDDDVIDAEIEAIEFELEQLTDALMHEAMSGRLEVSLLALTGTSFDPLNSLLYSM